MTAKKGDKELSPTQADQLRHAIDSGETGDKVPGDDPAAVPLGTDDEAAGRPPTPEEVSKAHHFETRRGISSTSPKAGGRRLGIVLMIVSILVVVGGIVLVFVT